MNDKEAPEDDLDVAIIGMAGRFPGAADIWRFWDNIAAGVESIHDITPEQLTASGVPKHQIENPHYVARAPILEHADCFDARFFGYSPREALSMDPQQRVFLEICWEALEHAGYNPAACDCRVGVFAGSAMNTYLLNAGLVSQFRDDYLPTLFGNDKDYLATRVAFKLNLRGPALTIQTACSSSLVAIHTACQSLLNGECEMALAGGAAIRVPLYAGHVYEEGSVFSADGHVRAFDHKANGTVFGSGAGAIVLKTMPNALENGDPILAVIKGSATNNDGASKSEFTAPSLTAQSDLIVEALATAGVSADSISCIEAHGTGTFLGDPIEIAALSRAFGKHTDRRNYCAVGSVKTNIGHLDAASGVASVIKIVLSMQHRKLPPLVGYSKPNPEIQFEGSPFYINTELRDWNPIAGVLRAGVTSIGIGGTNAHLIIDGPPEATAQFRDTSPPPQIYPVACKSSEALEQTSLRLANYFEWNSAVDPVDAAATLQARVGSFRYRMAVVENEISNVVAQLTARGQSDIAEQTIDPFETVFMCSAHELPHPRLNAELYQNYEAYRNACDSGCAILQELGLANIRKLILSGSDIHTGTGRHEPVQIHSAELVLFVVEYAMARLWQSFGVEPSSMIGHGVGAYVSATLAGVFTLADALAIVAERGRLLQSSDHGSIMVTTANQFRDFVANYQLQAPAIGLLSGRSGDWIQDSQATNPDFWAGHLHSAEPIASGFIASLRNQSAVVIGVGADPVLTSLVSQYRGDGEVRALASLPESYQEESAHHHFQRAIARYWTFGGKIDWGKTRPPHATRRLSLPGYAFERVRHWPEPVETKQDVLSPGKTTATATVYSPSWTRVKSLQIDGSRLPEKSWLAFISGADPMPQVVDYLRDSGAQVMTVWAGNEFQNLGPGQFVIDPHNLDSYMELLQTASDQATKPLRLLHLWNTGPATNELDHPSVERNKAFDSIIDLFIAAERVLKDELDLVVFTQAAQQVDGEDLVQPFRAMAEPACRALAEENPGAKALVVDLTAWEKIQGPLPWTMLLSLEPEKRGPLALRRGYLWRRCYVPADPGPAVKIREGGVYLITGGLGGIGQRIAARWASEYAATSVVMSRRKFPVEEYWRSESERALLPESQRETVERFLRATANHGKIEVLKGDITDTDDVTRVVRRIIEQHGRLDGVVHAAGFINPRICSLKSGAEIEAVLAPKLDGTIALVQALQEVNVDFVALFSSIRALQSAMGLVDYSAANAFMDAMAEASTSDNPMLSINWPNWQNVGMIAVEADSLDEAEGLQLFEESLQPSIGRIVISKKNAGEVHIADAPPQEHEQARKTVAVTIDASASPVEREIVTIWIQELGTDGVNLDDNFFELGGSSLIATRCLATIKQELGVKLELHVFLSAPTPRELAALVQEAVSN